MASEVEEEVIVQHGECVNFFHVGGDGVVAAFQDVRVVDGDTFSPGKERVYGREEFAV